MRNIRSYNELILFPTFEERFEYLQLSGEVGAATFGGSRYLNQNFYRTREWKRIRDQVIIRDMGCDLACPEYPIDGLIYIHHINPLTIDMIERSDSMLVLLDNLICTSYATHNAIHYGSLETIRSPFVERRPGDTCPWKN